MALASIPSMCPRESKALPVPQGVPDPRFLVTFSEPKKTGTPHPAVAEKTARYRPSPAVHFYQSVVGGAVPECWACRGRIPELVWVSSNALWLPARRCSARSTICAGRAKPLNFSSMLVQP